GVVAAAPCARAARSATEWRNGAATAAPPRPRRNSLRFMYFFMVRISLSVSNGAQTEGICLGKVGKDVEDVVVGAGQLLRGGVDCAGVLRVGETAGGVRHQALGVETTRL